MNTFAKIIIEMKQKQSDKEIKDFIENNLDMNDIKIDRIGNNEVQLQWKINSQDGIHGIEETLYYLLEDCQLGTFRYPYED